ncbi:RHS repeat-associated core domain-containing protein [Pseudomonas protegens]|uniref:RHS repeat-associated core domain-containing protein n=1 Tax=Pseudomonas protegens TaxID=380021 RepID=UPI000F4C6D0D|nr:RHS repeat-associated core domain-containing protein [Pseudomonas protegens]
MTDAQGHVVWRAYYKAWGGLEALSPNTVEQNLRFQGQYHDRESGLYYNTFRYYDPAVGRFTTQDPIGLAGGENLYRYAPNALGWVDPWGLSCRLNYMGRTPGKNSKTGRAVIERMRGEGRIRGTGDRMQFKSSTDNQWYRVQDADMAHLTDAVKYWSQKGGYYGPKSKEVRAFMRDSKNYELEYFGHNRSQGANLPDRYRNPGDFIGPAEKSQYFHDPRR